MFTAANSLSAAVWCSPSARIVKGEPCLTCVDWDPMAGILPIGAPGAPPPAPPIFRFVGGPAPHDTWVIGMPAVPELEVLIDEPFAAWARGWVWTPHPAAPAQPTHLRCPYKFVEAVLHGCQRSEDDALLESGSFSRYDRPSQLSEVLLALTETGKLLMTTLFTRPCKD